MWFVSNEEMLRMLAEARVRACGSMAGCMYTARCGIVADYHYVIPPPAELLAIVSVDSTPLPGRTGCEGGRLRRQRQRDWRNIGAGRTVGVC